MSLQLKRFARLEFAFVLISLLFGAFFILATPLFWGQDEETHFARAYQISTGTIFAKNLDSSHRSPELGYGGYIPRPAAELIAVRTKDILYDGKLSPTGTGKVDFSNLYSELGAQSINGKLVKYSFTNTSIYPPLAYLPSSFALWVSRVANLSIRNSIIFARLAGLLMYVLLAVYSLRLVKGSRFVWLVVVVGLMPTVLYQASIITTDVVVNALAIVLSAFIMKGWLLDRKLTKLETILLIVVIISLPLTKVTYGVMDLFILFIPDKNWHFKPQKLTKVLALAGALVTALLWNGLVANAARDLFLVAGPAGLDFNEKTQLHELIANPLHPLKMFARTLILQDNAMFEYMIGSFSAAMINAPGITYAIFAGLMALVTFNAGHEMRAIPKKVLLWSWGVMLLSIAAIIGTLYLAYTGVHALTIGGLQGRYFDPLLILGLLLVGLLLPRKDIVLKSSIHSAAIGKIVFSGAALGLLFAAVKFYYVLWG